MTANASGPRHKSAQDLSYNLPVTVARLDLGATPWKVDVIDLSAEQAE